MREEKQHILNEVLRLLSEKYPIGLYEYLYKHRPELYKQLLDIEGRFDQTYLNPLESISHLKAVLRDYWTFHIKSIKEFKQDETRVAQLDLNLVKIRDEMTGERERIIPKEEMSEERMRA